MTRLVRLRDEERGQIVPFVTILLPTLLLFVALVVNVGQAVNRRVAVQFLADTSAFTGATVLAVHLNQMAWTNKQLQRAWVLLTYSTGFFKLAPFCSVNDAAVTSYKAGSAGLRGMINVFNATGKLRAVKEADRVAFGETGNRPELFPGEDSGDFSFFAYTTSGVVPTFSLNVTEIEEVTEGTEPVAADSWTLDIPSWLQPFIPIDYTAKKSPVWLCARYWVPIPVFPYVAPVPALRRETFRLWVKETGAPETFITHIFAPEVPARLFPDIFGNIPKMRAAAAAKPDGGSIEEGRAEYVVKMVPVSSAYLPFDIVERPFPLRFILH